MRPLTAEQVNALRRLNTCAVSNAIEHFDLRLRNEGFADGTIRCQFDDLPPAVGHAVTARIRCSNPPPVGHGYIDRTDWWEYVTAVPAPRFLVVQDIDERPGLGAFVGQIHANIFKALGCVACATNGAVRDLPAVRAIGFQLFAAKLAVSHAFVHLIDFGESVTLGGLPIVSGEIVYGDRHGLLTVPADIVDEIPAVAAHMADEERRVIELCQSSQFSLDALRAVVRQLR